MKKIPNIYFPYDLIEYRYSFSVILSDFHYFDESNIFSINKEAYE